MCRNQYSQLPVIFAPLNFIARPASTGDMARRGLVVLKGFFGAIRIKVRKIDAGVDPEPASDTAEITEALGDRRERHIQLHTDGDRSQRVEDIVPARHTDIQSAELISPIVHHELCAVTLVDDFRGLEIRLAGEPVSHQAFFDLGNHPLQVMIIETQHDQPVEWHLVDKIDKGRANLIEILVVVEMVLIDIGDHGNGRRQLQERTIRFVGLGNQELALAELCVRTDRIKSAADHHGRIDVAMRENCSHHAGGCRLAVGTGDRDAVLHAHQFGQHLGTWNHGDFTPVGFLDFRIVLLYGGRGHHHVDIGEVLAAMTI